MNTRFEQIKKILAERETLQNDYQAAVSSLNEVSDRCSSLRTELSRLEADRNALLLRREELRRRAEENRTQINDQWDLLRYTPVSEADKAIYDELRAAAACDPFRTAQAGGQGNVVAGR